MLKNTLTYLKLLRRNKYEIKCEVDVCIYGFYDSYNLEKGVWIAKDVIGIDKGVSLLMIENYQSEFVWEVFMDCEFMDTAIKVLKFKKA